MILDEDERWEKKLMMELDGLVIEDQEMLDLHEKIR